MNCLVTRNFGMKLVLIGLFSLFSVGCSGKKETTNAVSSQDLTASRLVDELNDWDTNELEAYMAPNLDPTFVVHGETTYWIEEHIDEINKHGKEVKWLPDEKRFVLVPQGEGDKAINNRANK